MLIEGVPWIGRRVADHAFAFTRRRGVAPRPATFRP
jgi:hypothetical protein